MRSVLLWGSRNEWLRSQLPKYGIVRRAVSRFMPGERLEDALDAAELLKADGLSTVLTKLGENITSADEANAVAEHYREVLDKVKTRGLDCHISVKLTQLGLDLNPELCVQHLESIVKHAETTGNFVWVDMEYSQYVDVTLEVFTRVRSVHANTGLCLQAYLYRTADDLQKLLSIPAAIRLVKGAYAEPENIAYQKKQDVDKQYYAFVLELLKRTQANNAKPGIATHDKAIIERTQAAIGAMELPKNTVEFQLLYGIQREEQLRLSREGYKTRVLISYGSYWFPWYMRRLAERPANVWFVMKNIFG
ncbi:MAG: proline dehydrogenase family protein [Ignavibacteriae bacterium]|nr:proline dehydrogenase family protein [Ignavibacteriota bacterium]